MSSMEPAAAAPKRQVMFMKAPDIAAPVPWGMTASGCCTTPFGTLDIVLFMFQTSMALLCHAGNSQQH
ncbi:hypothetical protein TSA66_00695 [Noviherbaspirillum autotrophicum]|uniref:Uncharacterized protein n=1 Tax=Noviherbaspirillum autotrophicum TaxID=709839 RepID=A0A0C2BS89_9BURK|nr:hypothetical protein TSA66_14000 [Noviherbaspirillum autotrophicum]KIF82013.1 hypothetical protein TSA66_16335 [Noviherbaspirillum autotrophicum]KIF84100.1 hypothetical protein TSA66_00695 [Noviherbaspirillum autotrophicum]